MIRNSEIDSLVVTASGMLVGFRQPTLATYNILDTVAYTSLSGLYVDDVSGLITVKNVKSSQEDTGITTANFNTWLKNRMKSSMKTLLHAVFSERDLVENAVLYKYENDWIAANKLTNATDFVGYEIDLAKTKDLALVVNKILLEFDAADTVKLLLFHSSSNAVVSNQEVTTTADTATASSVGWDLPAFNTYNGGKYYIGYLRSGLTAQAYNRDYERANVRTRFKTVGIRPIQVSGWDAETLFDVNDIEYTSETWGLNFDISVLKDMTSYVVENKDRFARALQLQAAADLLNILATSGRSNRDERNVKAEALFELNGNRNNPQIPYTVGVLKQLQDEIDKLRKLFAEPRLQVNTMR